MSETTPLFSTTYRISKEDYMQYNLDMAAASMRKNRRRQSMFGILWVVIGALLIAASAAAEEPTPWYMYLINAVIILFGIHSLIYYRFFFSRNLRKAVDRAYPKSEYLTNEITVDFFEDHFRERGAGRDNVFLYSGIDGVQIDQNFIHMLCDKQKSVILLIDKLPQGMYAPLFSFLRNKCLGEMKTFIDKEALLPEGVQKAVDWNGGPGEDYSDTPPPLMENDPDIDFSE